MHEGNGMTDNARNLHELRELVGDEAYEAIVCRFSGESLYIQHNAYILVRDAMIRREYDRLLCSKVVSSRAIGALCRRYRLSERSIRRILRGT